MSSWMWPSSVRFSTSSRSKSAAPWKIGSSPVWPVMTGKSVTCRRSTRPAAISARFNDRLPCERNGTSDSSLSRATTSTASPLTRVASGQSRGPSSVVDTTVAGMLLIRVTHGSRASDCSVLEASIRANARYVLAPKTIPLLLAVQGEAVVGQLRALLAPVAAPVAAVGAEAIEAGKDVEGVGSGHDALLSAGDRVCGYRLETTAKLIAVGLLESGRIGCGPTVVPANASISEFGARAL